MITEEIPLSAVEKETDTPFIDTHQCDGDQRIPGQFILRAAWTTEYCDPGWYLVRVCTAIEGDVLAGDAESIGEIIESSMTAIVFCPFCGVALPTDNDSSSTLT
ncbi:MAG: hypothetical protein AAF351_14025 [Pseudomonadota bacterium]